MDNATIWNNIADAYSQGFTTSDGAAYAKQIISVLSDAQELHDRGDAVDANHRINAAKVMLARLADRMVD